MTTNLTESEREVWKDLYMLHESVHDMLGTDVDWVKFANRICELHAKYTGSDQRLMDKLALALYDYMSEEQVLRETAERLAPQQIAMEGIPWS